MFGAELSLGLRKPQNGEADPEGQPPGGAGPRPAGLRPPGPHASAPPSCEGARRASRVYVAVRARARLHGGALARAHRLPQGHGARRARARRPGRGGPRARPISSRCSARDNVAVELWDHGDPLDSARNDALAQLAGRGRRRRRRHQQRALRHAGPPPARHRAGRGAGPPQPRRARRLAARRRRRPPARRASSRPRRFARYPGVVERAAELGLELRVRPPAGRARTCRPYPVPRRARRDAVPAPPRRARARSAATARGRSDRVAEQAYAQIDHELDLIEALGFPGYFLIVWDIVEFCRRSNIYCQGRGRPPTRAVCYALGITNADAVALGLLFERFLSPERDGPPDIDIDIESDRREEAIQYVYERYGREHAAQVANVITYRAKSSIRDMAKALGYSTGQQDAWSKQADAWGRGRHRDSSRRRRARDPADRCSRWPQQVEHFPRHLGIHSGGMVICDRPIVEVCPIEWAAHGGPQSVLQWDKDDCAAAGLVKFDLLGLGMLTALHHTSTSCASTTAIVVDLATIPQDDEVYDMLCRADSVGVFQVEIAGADGHAAAARSRARFYDLVVEVALIRPGPDPRRFGAPVHPPAQRHEPVTYLHPLLEPVLEKTLGVPTCGSTAPRLTSRWSSGSTRCSPPATALTRWSCSSTAGRPTAARSS